jgi:hypothetical protein
MLNLVSITFWISSSIAQAEELEVRKSNLYDISTQTVPQGTYTVGILKQSYGLSDKIQLGTNALILPIRAFSLSVKGNVFQREYRDYSAERNWMYINLSQSDSSRYIMAQKTKLTMGRPRRSRLFFYSQYEHFFIRARGDFSPVEVQEATQNITGSSLALPNNIGASVSANLTIHTISFTTEWQRKPGKSFLFYFQYSLWANGYVIGGVQQNSSVGSLDTGVAAYLRSPLYALAPVAAVVAYQRDWNRFHFRAGIPLSSGPNFILLIPKTFTMYWTF